MPHSCDRRTVLAAMLSAPLLAAARGPAPSEATIGRLFENSFARRLAASPLLQARLGIRTSQSEWDDIGEARQTAEAAANREEMRAARSYLDRTNDPALRLSLRLFLHAGEIAESDFRWRRHAYLVSQMTGLHDRVTSVLLNNHPIRDEGDAAAYIDRLRSIPRLFDQLIAALEAQHGAGVAPPAFILTEVSGAIARLLSGIPLDAGPADNIVFADFITKIGKAGIAPDRRVVLAARARDAMLSGFAPAYRRLQLYLDRLADVCGDANVGASALPDGAAFYMSRLTRATTLSHSAADLHRIGRVEVDAILRRMAGIANERGFTGNLRAFWHHLEGDAGQWFAATDEGRAAYLAEAEALLVRAADAGRHMFTAQPRIPVEIRRVEAWREAAVPKAFYASPPHDGARPGIYYVNLYDMRAVPRYELPALLFHEAVPGHHIETTLADQGDDLPMFRKMLSVPAYSEGWGLYAEHLAEEHGLYPDSLAIFGLLSMRLLRAARVVADTGLHAFGWTREQAVAYLDDLLPITPRNNRLEVDRYIAIPGQATAYLIGYRELLRLRRRAAEAKGAAFDVRAFHDVVLGQGPLPLPMLAEIIGARFGTAV